MFDCLGHEWGSSPLTRGKRDLKTLARMAQGLIPTHAGKTLCLAFWFALLWAHPHSRGENSTTSRCDAEHTGSSPLTRGKPLARMAQVEQRGLIPTHAGKTHRGQSAPARPEAHPHSRGENPGRGFAAPVSAGSSPLTRGKQLAGHVARVGGGLIPTHAGKTRGPCGLAGARAAHPHSRGENKVIGQGYDSSWGSSPLTRGKQRRVDESADWEGLIPTHAGKTWPCASSVERKPAHPHSRGENSRT